MRKLAICIAFLIIPSMASAQSIAYLEGSIGAAIISDVDASIDNLSTPLGPLTATATGDYDTAVLYGIEAGISSFGNNNNIRFGVSWDYVNAEISSVSVSGTLDGVPFSETISRSDFSDLGLETADAIHVLAGNAYYELPVANMMSLQPYIGVGAGMAFIENADSEFALSGTLGARLSVGDNVYLGGRYRLQYISGPTDDFGAEYDSIYAHGFSVVLGVTFN